MLFEERFFVVTNWNVGKCFLAESTKNSYLSVSDSENVVQNVISVINGDPFQETIFCLRLIAFPLLVIIYCHCGQNLSRATPILSRSIVMLHQVKLLQYKLNIVLSKELENFQIEVCLSNIFSAFYL